jgi:hypothetical protein
METLTAQNVQEIKALALDPTRVKAPWVRCKPVFLTTLTTGTRLVVKAERTVGNPSAQVQDSFRWGSRMMKQVTPEVHGHPLSHPEVMDLGRLTLNQFSTTQNRTNARAFLQDLLGEPGNFWVKLDFVQQLQTLEDMVEKNGTGLLALAALKSNDALRILGRIVAVDIFLGNYDRFRSDGSLGGADNFFLQQVTLGNLKPIGLDFFMGTFGATEINLCRDPLPNWGGLKLNDGSALTRFSKACIASLNNYCTKEFQKNGTAYGPQDLIDPKSWSDFYMGLSDGQVGLKNYLKTKQQAGKLPSGVVKRLKMLNWIT